MKYLLVIFPFVLFSCNEVNLLPLCGDLILDPGEECDDGNNADGDGCRSDCSFEICGDGILDTDFGEECDNGPNNADDPNIACRTNCTLLFCGDGILDTDFGEECDEAEQNSDEPNAPSGCRAGEQDKTLACTPLRCGDGIIDNEAPNNEACDGGAGCQDNCQPIP